MHYAYLPYRKQRSYFLDGEGFAMGCIRCPRPFYEYEHQFESYLYTLRDFSLNKSVRPASWPHQQLNCGGESSTPQPFHGCGDRFRAVPLDWEDHPDKGREFEIAAVGDDSQVEPSQGAWKFAGWPVFFFDMSDTDLARRSKSDAYDGFASSYERGHPTFRRVYNSLYEHR